MTFETFLISWFVVGLISSIIDLSYGYIKCYEIITVRDLFMAIIISSLGYIIGVLVFMILVSKIIEKIEGLWFFSDFRKKWNKFLDKIIFG